jgi:putative transposase
VIERWYESIKYEHLYVHEIDDGSALAEHVTGHQRAYNDERPHETLGRQKPTDRCTQAPA